MPESPLTMICPRCQDRVEVNIRYGKLVFASHTDEQGRDCEGPDREVELPVAFWSAPKHPDDHGGFGGGFGHE